MIQKILFSLATIFFSLWAVNFVCLPFYKQIIEDVLVTPQYVPLLGVIKSRFGYDVLAEHAINMWAISALGGYASMGLICAVMDLTLPLSYKTQGSRSYFTLLEWLEAVALSLFNLFITSWAVALPVALLWKPREFMSDLNAPIDIKLELIKFIGCVVVVEVWFYFTHYALHHPALYSKIHKLHHRFKAPVAVASMYAHPIEFAVGNLSGVVLGPLLTRCHPVTSFVWVFNALLSTGGGHSGYKMFEAEYHDAHHQYFDYNFGVGDVIDALMGTLWVGSEKWKKLQKQQQQGATTKDKDKLR